MKNIKIILIFFFLLFNMNLLSKEKISVYDFKFVDIDGNNIELTKFEGKPILLVNTASRCGFTPQYQGLQNLFLNYRKTDLTIIATTSNSFNQEYSSTEEIKKICLVSYDVGFIVSSPISVKGREAHPLYQWINEKYNKKPKWNFYKYLFNTNGELIDSWSSITKPDSEKIIKKIDKLIKKKSRV